MSRMKSRSLTSEWSLKLPGLRVVEESGIPGGAVKCVDIGRNTRGEGGSLSYT
jgi:hypothetical protein